MSNKPRRSILGISRSIAARQLQFLITIALVAGIAMGILPARVAHAEGPNAILDLTGCTANSLAANDDSSAASFGLPFTLNYFGNNYGALFVNNNGNVTFDSALSAYTPYGLVGSTRPIIAPYFADVDTRGTGSGLVTYGATSYSGRDAFCVNWVNVGYYSGGVNKLNSFQLLLVERFDTGPGNFDVFFNYDKVQWETGGASGGSGGLGGYSAHIGYSNGLAGAANVSFELPGSGVNGAFLDSNTSTGLIVNSRDSLQNGRYVFPVRNGIAPAGGTISGTVYANSVAPANVLVGAFVQVCAGNVCHTTSTNASGQYSVIGLADGSAYTATAFPPGGSSLLPNTIGPLAISGANTLAGQDIVLTGPTPLPAGTTIEPSTTGGDGLPRVYWGNPLVLEKIGCAGGTASHEITQGATVIRSGAMAEGPAGTYSATVAAFYPLHGNAHVEISLVCSGVTTVIEGDIYIDPSGLVKTTAGIPIAGATVTLYRSDASSGPFTQVPNGSGIMSPANQNNPDSTDATGHFGWDVIAGFYKVRAEKAGCVSAANPAQAFVETIVMTIPPPVTNLELVLNCGEAQQIYLPLILR